MVQTVEYLPNKCKALSSKTLLTTKKKEEEVKFINLSWMPIAHAYNPTNLGG
jgi:hypothetical protein